MRLHRYHWCVEEFPCRFRSQILQGDFSCIGAIAVIPWCQNKSTRPPFKVHLITKTVFFFPPFLFLTSEICLSLGSNF